MPPEKDRRFLERISINGAKIVYRLENEKRFLRRFSDPVPLSDLTWSSLRFEADSSLAAGELIDLQILIPGEEKISVKGHLIWNSRSDKSERNYVVVQLLPFGPGRNYNPIPTREILKRIINRFRKSAEKIGKT
jgi:hypothetical protein